MSSHGGGMHHHGGGGGMHHHGGGGGMHHHHHSHNNHNHNSSRRHNPHHPHHGGFNSHAHGWGWGPSPFWWAIPAPYYYSPNAKRARRLNPFLILSVLFAILCVGLIIVIAIEAIQKKHEDLVPGQHVLRKVNHHWWGKAHFNDLGDKVQVSSFKHQPTIGSRTEKWHLNYSIGLKQNEFKYYGFWLNHQSRIQVEMSSANTVEFYMLKGVDNLDGFVFEDDFDYVNHEVGDSLDKQFTIHNDDLYYFAFENSDVRLKDTLVITFWINFARYDMDGRSDFCEDVSGCDLDIDSDHQYFFIYNPVVTKDAYYRELKPEYTLHVSTIWLVFFILAIVLAFIMIFFFGLIHQCFGFYLHRKRSAYIKTIPPAEPVGDETEQEPFMQNNASDMYGHINQEEEPADYVPSLSPIAPVEPEYGQPEYGQQGPIDYSNQPPQHQGPIDYSSQGTQPAYNPYV